MKKKVGAKNENGHFKNVQNQKPKILFEKNVKNHFVTIMVLKYICVFFICY